MAKRIQVGGRIESKEVGGIVTGAAEILDDAKGKKQSVINQDTDDELLRLDQSKQDNLTFDNAPTEGSDNPVKSGGVYAADKALSDAIEAILLLIPSAASALNKLVDTSMMNSSISTAAATFRGTYNVVTDLSLTVDATHEQIAAALGNAISTADNNDYAFVQVPVSAESTDIRRTERYKFNGTAWGYEYDLNTSGFTAAQWAAINSGITVALVGKLIGLPTSSELQALLGQKQDTLTFDNVPTAGSANPVKSGGVHTAINDEKTAREQLANTVTGIDGRVENIEEVIPTGAAANNKLVANNSMEAYVTSIIEAITASFTIATADGHINLTMTQTNGRVASLTLTSSDIASAQALTALTGRVSTAEGNITTLGGRVSTNETDIANLQQLYNNLQQSKPVPVTELPSTGQQQGVIYRLAGTTSYSDYMWNGSTWVLMATYNNAIDPRPKKASQNLVTSGGVFDNMGALDVSELNATENPHTLAQYVDLSAALAAIPTDYQKGGMSIKFVQSSDNKYVQCRLMVDSFTTDVTQWQGIDNEPTAGSENLVKSGGISETRLTTNILDKNYFVKNCYIAAATGAEIPHDNTITGGFIKVIQGKMIRFKLNGFKRTITLYDQSKNIIGIDSWFGTAEYYVIPNNVYYIRLSIRNADNSDIDHTTFASYIQLYYQLEDNAISPTYLNRIGKYDSCPSAANVQVKELTIDGYTISLNNRLIIRMVNANTYNGDCSLSINGNTYPLRYNGSIASASNSWVDNEYLDVFFNGSEYVAKTFNWLMRKRGKSEVSSMSQNAIEKIVLDIRRSTEQSILNNAYFIYNAYYNDSGILNINDNFLTGDLIAVLPNTAYSIKHLNGNLCALFFFDENKAYIGYDVWYDASEKRIIPANVRYIAVSLKNTNGLTNFDDYIVISKTNDIVWQNKNVIQYNDQQHEEREYYLQNEKTRGCSGILKFNKNVFVGLKRTEETEPDTEEVTDGDGNVHDVPIYKVVTNYNFLVVFIKDGKIDHETPWTKYEQEIPANKEFIIILKYQNDDTLSYANRRTVDVSALNDVVCVSDEHIPLVLPKYYIENNYLDGKVAFINNLIKGCATNGDIFFHISDLHWQGNQQHSPALIKYIADRVPIQRMFNTGDDFDGTAFRASSTLYVNVNPLNPIKMAFQHDYHWVVGNHDHLLGYENSYNDLCAQKQQLNTKAVFGGTTHSYYYVDNQQQKIRYIILDAFDAGEGSGVHMGTIQKSWLQNNALNVESGWTIILFIHMIYYEIVYSETFDFAALSGWGLELANIITEYNGNGTIAAVFQGDAHVDRIFRLPNSNIPVICTTTDKCDGGMNQVRTVGTINEQAFDVVVVDKTNRKITCVRIGAKAKDGVGLTTQGNDVEYREIIY